MKRLFILVVCCVCATQAGAQEKPPRVTIETLFQLCTGNQESQRYLHGSQLYLQCLLYVGGFIDGYMTAEGFADKQQRLLCLPPGITPKEAAEAFVRVWRSLNSRPGFDETKDFPFEIALPGFLREAVPVRQVKLGHCLA
jgi:hypothetical protein